MTAVAPFSPMSDSNQPGTTPQYLTPEEVARILRVTSRTVTAWLNAGTLPGVKIGKVWRIPSSALPSPPSA